MRGWSCRVRKARSVQTICPAYAGVIPAKFDDLENSLHLSRVCGGDPNVIFVEKVVTVFVPRMRGWSWRDDFHALMDNICPAYAGVIPTHSDTLGDNVNLSRVCGGDPVIHIGNFPNNLFVPRMRGWSCRVRKARSVQTICPAYAGVIPAKFDDLENSLHLSRVCGGDPNVIFVEKVVTVFVPRMRGWS